MRVSSPSTVIGRQPTYRFSNAKSIQELGQMLDRSAYAKRDDGTVVWSSYAYWASSSSPMRVGSLVQVGSTGGVSLASSTAQAQMVVVEVKRDGKFLVSPEAVLFVRLPSGVGSPTRPLYSADNGGITVNLPSSGWPQRVGEILSYDSSRDAYLCHIHPTPQQAEGDLIVPYGYKLKFLAADGSVAGYIYLNSDGQLELDRGSVGQTW